VPKILHGPYMAQPPGPQPGLPHPPQGRSAIGRPEGDVALTGAAGTLNCLVKRSPPQCGQAGFSPERTSNSNPLAQASHWYS
jgi:hypothetical protein